MPAAVNTGGVPFFDRQIVIQWISKAVDIKSYWS